MKDEAVDRIIKLIQEKMGIDIGAIEETCIQKLIIAKMHELKIPTFENYYRRLSQSEKEFVDLIEGLVVPETWFFRNSSSIEFLADYIKKVLIPSYFIKRRVHILSMPCSTGEEPYSIAIELLNAGLKTEHFVIDGIDISQLVLKKALEGSYTLHSFRGLSKNDEKIKKYFEEVNSTFNIKQSVKDCVRFFQANALDKTCLIHKKYYDLIFCRNLFIYLNENARNELLNNLNELLTDNGILIVSPVEIEYVKKAGYMSYPSTKSYSFHKNKLINSSPNDIEEKKEWFSPLVETVPPIGKSILVMSDPLSRATELSNAGCFDDARIICEEYLSIHGPHAKAYFLLGLIKHALKKEDEAEAYWLKTIYLDPLHYEALIYLALLAKKRGDEHQAQLFFNRAKRLDLLKIVQS